MVDQKKLQKSIDRSEIINVVSRSIITRDSGLWEQFAEFFHSEAEFTSSWWQGKPSDVIKVASKKLEAVRIEGGEQKPVTSNLWMAKFPRQIRHHLWCNSVTGSEPAKELCIRGTDQEKVVRATARDWIAGEAVSKVG